MTKEKAKTMIADDRLKHFLDLVRQAKAQYYKLLSSGESPAYCGNPAIAFCQYQGAAAAYKQMLGTLDEFELRLKSMLDEGDALSRAAHAAEEGKKWIKIHCPQTELAKGGKEMTHLLKLADKYWVPVAAGLKTFEVRYNDRGFKVGDSVRFRRVETEHEMGLTFIIAYLLTHDDFPEGIPEGWCVFGISQMEE